MIIKSVWFQSFYTVSITFIQFQIFMSQNLIKVSKLEDTNYGSKRYNQHMLLQNFENKSLSR
jgi:hypothetical protein